MTGKNITRTLVIGDIHGAHIPLQQCLERCEFDYENDLLITLADICDGWPYVYECVEILLKCKRIDLIGNHCNWFSRFLTTGEHPEMWSQGGKGTAQSYLRAAGKDENDFHSWGVVDRYGHQRNVFKFNLDPMDVPPSHSTFFKQQRLYYKDEFGRLFIHAGFDRSLTLMENQQKDPSIFYWDRKLFLKALSVHGGESMKYAEEGLKEIFIGHTQTTIWSYDETYTPGGIIKPGKYPVTKPIHADIIWNLDTGAGSNGKLTIMDVDTHEYWQSDNVNEIYGEYKPRG